MAEFITKYIGPNLADLFDDQPAKDACKRLADMGGDRLHETIAIYTPLKTGNLRSSWFRAPTIDEGTRYTSYVRTEVSYAPYVNYGTGLWGPEHRKYLIEPHPPRRFLAWYDPKSAFAGKSGWVYARRVWHPGSEGAHMVQKGALETEAVFGRWAELDLQQFKADMEALAIKAQGSVKV